MHRHQPQPKPRNGLVAALDIGSTKVSCLIARKEGTRPPRVIGVGHHASAGVKNGTIVDMEQAEATVRAAVGAAEEMAGANIESVFVSLTGTAFNSRLVAYDINISGHEIGDQDLRKILDATRLTQSLPQDQEIVHSIPVGYSIDGNRGVRDPRGMFGDSLGVNLHVVTAQTNALRNIDTCLHRCHLDVDGHVVSPYASAMSALVEDEMKLGVTLVDMGGGTTNISVFFDGELMHADCIPVGGMNVTNDIARGLSTPVQHAERMKTLYGNCMPSPKDDLEVLKVQLIGEEQTGETNEVPRSMLVGIIRPRLEETFELVRDRLHGAGFERLSGPRLVLTGGASLLPGVRELAGEILGKDQVRMAKPRYLEGMAEVASGPQFSACAGLVNYAYETAEETLGRTYRPKEQPASRFGKIGQWLRDNF
ncbi:cell division protein FtsA [Magnetovibrio sp. PR-2]|uniref:cell division protein FtsA n=1 Tax=Magnetovibrio sp. PR-2 TaxID=3120356 RepID=UPI002FCE2EDA